MWWKIGLGIVAGLGLVFAAGSTYGAVRWQQNTQDMRATLEAHRRSSNAGTYDPAELTSVPAVVRRFFEAALTPGQAIITAADIEHSGTFNMSEDAEQWRPFTSRQRVVTDRPGFDWDARISMAPGLPAYVHDAYIAGEGILHASLRGLITVADMRGTPEMAHGEFMRFFAEAAWYPTALLPSQGVEWLPVDGHSARAVMRDGDLELTLLFRFRDDGLIDSVYAESRERVAGGSTELRPWEGRFFDYQEAGGMMIPMQGEVAWILDDGRKPYWRGTTERISFEPAL
jgi:hypothetical protein